MVEGELQGVEGEAVEAEALSEEPVVLSLAVADIADQRMADVFEVAADLVQAAGFRGDLDQGVAFEGGEAAEGGDGGDASPPRGAGDGMVDHPLLGRDAAYQGEVALGHAAGLEPLLDAARRAGVERQEQDAAGCAVEPVDGVDVAPQEVARNLHGDDLLPRPAAVDGHP
jgi:hypothetical protein